MLGGMGSFSDHYIGADDLNKRAAG